MKDFTLRQCAAKLLLWLAIPLSTMFLAGDLPSAAQVETVLHNFGDGSVTGDGYGPEAPMILATDGNFYGTTSNIRIMDNLITLGPGAVFEMSPTGDVTILHTFNSSTVVSDGVDPAGGLVQGSDGNLYGATTRGGSAGLGTVYEITPGNPASIAILHSFGDGTVSNDGAEPDSGLIQGTDGNFYGTTAGGGVGGEGTVYEIAPTGKEWIVHSFGDGTVANDGADPQGGVIQGSDGNFYGTTYEGGSAGGGTVYTTTESGAVTILHSFGDGSVTNDGSEPFAPPVEGPGGVFYGTTKRGGAGFGTVFTTTSTPNSLAVLHSFGDGSVPDDGSVPASGLIQGIDGNLYGTTYAGGSTALYGTVYKITPGGKETILDDFVAGTTPTDGCHPEAALVQDAQGNLYGTTFQGGSTYRSGYIPFYGLGTAFELVLPAIASMVPESVVAGGPGVALTVNGQGFAPGSTVLWNGVAIQTSYVSSEQLTASVPPASTALPGTDSVAVQGPSGDISNSESFTVAAPVLQSLTLAPAKVTGGSSSTGTVALDGPAPTGGVVVTVRSSAPKIAGFSASTVTIPAGSTSATFTVNTVPVSGTRNVTIAGVAGGASASAKLTVAAPELASLAVGSNPVVGGNSTTATVSLNGVAASPVTVDVSINCTGLSVPATAPATVVVASGSSSAQFAVNTSAVPRRVSVTMKVKYGGVTKSIVLTIKP
jgi:uncharacterized repeat protein (TIGR03803 family)